MNIQTFPDALQTKERWKANPAAPEERFEAAQNNPDNAMSNGIREINVTAADHSHTRQIPPCLGNAMHPISFFRLKQPTENIKYHLK
ncbi:MAG: hypothetical protein LBR80_05950 [Deltaproteobacteria bacterium]|jgi:hypothetical protein|nr:hypothetical protein [Deltaproteobacteria bacterium]